MPIDSSLELIVALLYAPGSSGKYGESIRGITRLEKLVFLISKEGIKDAEKFFEFQGYNYGPYSAKIYDDIETLKNEEYVDTQIIKTDEHIESLDKYAVERELGEGAGELTVVPSTEFSTEIYRLSGDGRKVGKYIFENLRSEEREFLRRLKTKCNSMPLKSLIYYVYSHYPEYTTESKIRKKVLGR